ncbi:superoxide reductase, partial [Candidatus Magnetomorum sp. HK-1]
MNLSESIKQEDQGKEKHVPDIDVKECASCGELSVTIQIGKDIMHPSTKEHSIKTITLYGITTSNMLKQLSTIVLGDENTIPRVRTSVKKGEFKELIATA